MLTLGTAQAVNAEFTIMAGKAQAMGTYHLASGFKMGAGASFAVAEGDSLMGFADVNGEAMVENGVSYRVSGDKKNNVTLKLSVAAGTMEKGGAGADRLFGTVDSDIFYGGGGNDKIIGENGRDVAVYDKKAWGRDVIGETSGTMTLVLAGLKKSAVKTKLTGTNMTITKKSDAGQKIVVKGWSAETHRIVYNATAAEMKAFTAYLIAASPTDAQ